MGVGGLGLIGFISPAGAKWFIFIFLCYNRTCVHLGFSGIGFVLGLKGFDWL